MTANVTIVSASREDALKISNAALRFRPRDERRADAGGGASGMSGMTGQAGTGRAGGGAAAGGKGGRAMRDEGPGRAATAYVLADSSGRKSLKAVRIRVGITDGTLSELLPGTIEAGAMVVIGQGEEDGKRQTTNPFQQTGGGPRGGGSGGGRTGGGRTSGGR
jgi:hypothetical protein